MKKIVSFIFSSFFLTPYFLCADVIQIDLSEGGLRYFDSTGGPYVNGPYSYSSTQYSCTVTQEQLKNGCSIQLISKNSIFPELVYKYYY